jgi:hypothetical protein
MRALALIHRYLGIALGFLVVGWCLSGIVMMYVPYPELRESERVRTLQPLSLETCCRLPAEILPDTARVTGFQVEMLATRPVLRLHYARSRFSTIDLTTGKPIDSVSSEEALQIAASYNRTPEEASAPHGVLHWQLQEPLDYDEWTVSGEFDMQRPLYRLAANDTVGTEIYISSTTGKVVQTTTASARLWSWLGSVPHWIYFAQLRRNVRVWTEVVVWTSLLGCFLTVTGIILGIQRFVRSSPGSWSPYRGLLLWHHVPGLIFGVFALTWVASGLLSMNPWGLLESQGPTWEARQIAGPPLAAAQIRSAIQALASGELPPDALSIVSAPLQGRLFLISTSRTGARTRLNESGVPTPLTGADLKGVEVAVAGPIRTGQASAVPALLTAPDHYYFAHGPHTVRLPVYRIVAADPSATRYYLDATSGEILEKVDANGRRFRWLHAALHRLDFSATLRERPVWDLVMLVLLGGVTALAATGAVLGIRRLCGMRPAPETGPVTGLAGASRKSPRQSTQTPRSL